MNTLDVSIGEHLEDAPSPRRGAERSADLLLTAKASTREEYVTWRGRPANDKQPW